MSPLLRRSGALVASAVIAVTGLTFAAAPAQAASDPRPASLAASWIEGELVGGLLPSKFGGGFSDPGLTIDAGLSLIEVGGHAATVTSIGTGLQPKIGSEYAQSDEFSFPENEFVQKGLYAGPTAKALVFAQAANLNTATWAGFNLVTATEDRVTAAGVSTGRIADDSSFGDFGNSIGQAFAVRGLTVAGSDKAAAATAFLLKQQCTAGFFRLYFNPANDETDQTCDGGTAEESPADTDVTALTVLQLKAIPNPSQAVIDALAKARTWLLATQGTDGSFGGGPSTPDPNTNSTGLAGWALGELGGTDALAAAGKAAVWVRRHQADERPGCATQLFPETGALALNDEALAAGRADGLPTLAIQDQWRRATAPTLPVLQYAPARIGTFDIDGPVGYRKGGSVAIYKITGLAPGAAVCLRAFGNGKQLIGDAAGRAQGAFTLPNVAGRVPFRVEDPAGFSASGNTLVLTAKTLSVASPSSAKKNSVVTVTVRGLAAAEKVKVTYRGVTVRTGLANGNGVFVAKFNVGTKLGLDAVRAFGQFDTRKGYDLLKVVS